MARPADAGAIVAGAGDSPHSAVDDRWSLLVSAIHGGQLTLVPGSDLYTDGRTITYDPLSSTPDGLAVQAALLAVGSFPGHVVRRLIARPRARSPYLLLESRRAAEHLVDVLPPRTVRRIVAAYDGPVPASSEESLRLATAGGRGLRDAPDWMGTIKPARLLRAHPATGGRPPTKADRLGQTEEVDVDESDDDAPESKLFKLLQAPGGSRNPLARYLQKLLGVGTSAGGDDAAGGEEMPVAGHRAAVGQSLEGRVLEVDQAPPELVFDAAPKGRAYPEWDYHRQRYRTEWCRVSDYDPRATDGARFAAPTDLRLRRELARIGMSPERHRRQSDGDGVDIEAVIERRVDRRAGRDAGDDRIYERRLRTAHDLGVLLLLDATGSTGESEEGKRIFDEQRLIVASLASQFDSLGVRVAAHAFQSWGRQNVQFLRIKRYEDRFNSAVEHRLQALEPGGFTRLGAAIRHGAHVARTGSGASTDLLVVVGDGLPYDDGYEGRYAQEDCRRALSEAMEVGVASACLSVRTATDAATLERTWGSVPYAALETPDELATCVSDLFRRALKTAAASRRRID